MGLKFDNMRGCRCPRRERESVPGPAAALHTAADLPRLAARPAEDAGSFYRAVPLRGAGEGRGGETTWSSCPIS